MTPERDSPLESAPNRKITVSSTKNKNTTVSRQSNDNKGTTKKAKTEAISENSGPKIINSAGKPRRTLFTPNSGDWSDATEELSESSLLSEMKESGAGEVLSPVDTISGLFQLLGRSE